MMMNYKKNKSTINNPKNIIFHVLKKNGKNLVFDGFSFNIIKVLKMEF